MTILFRDNQDQKIMGIQNKSMDIPDIDGYVLKSARESRGLSHDQLAQILCLSPKHIHQLEGGGISVFFSLKHRYQVALKVANYFGLQPSDIWVDKFQLTPAPNSIANEVENEQAVFELEETLIHEPQLESNLLKVQSNSRIPYASKLRYVVLLSVLVPVFYWTAESLIIQDSLTSVALVEANSDELDKKLVLSGLSEIKSVDICDLSEFVNIPLVSVELPLKKGDNLFVLAKSDQPICVIDSIKKVSSFNLNAETKQIIVGNPPFIINALNFNGLEIYFQGRKVSYPTNWQGPMKLIEGSTKDAVN